MMERKRVGGAEDGIYVRSESPIERRLEQVIG